MQKLEANITIVFLKEHAKCQVSADIDKAILVLPLLSQLKSLIEILEGKVAEKAIEAGVVTIEGVQEFMKDLTIDQIHTN